MLNWFDHACRLYANDRVDAFIAVYHPPAQSYIGNVAHLQWRGLLSPIFVQKVLDVIL